MQEKALSLVLNLILIYDNRVVFVIEGAIEKIAIALRGNLASCKALTAIIITSLAVVEVNKALIRECPFAVVSLIALRRDENGLEKEASTALFAICSFSNNRKRAIASAVVLILLGIMDSCLEKVVEVLGLVAMCGKGREFCMSSANGEERKELEKEKIETRGTRAMKGRLYCNQ
ncbi:hypothetical protein CDL15_Pgr006525 [Punica granatum]|uniref:Uncharacterized protein n=1 Tax=Punica granatum TaxID=22663 RepID=A0A218XZ12_PUNGR|nr:hypothetical protein CDL15_Pgr006525 [Punica granatum]PKI61039.1 hypothetical protein CRG98_018560 [Punica granatum]